MGSDFVNTTASWRADRRILLAEIAGLLVGPTGNHNAGDLSFGKNGYLHVSVGDGQCEYAQNSGCQINNGAARDSHVLLGKILRITPSGGIPANNPYQGTDSARCNLTGRTDVGKNCRKIFASGLRNPFRFAFDPSGTLALRTGDRHVLRS